MRGGRVGLERRLGTREDYLQVCAVKVGLRIYETITHAVRVRGRARVRVSGRGRARGRARGRVG